MNNEHLQGLSESESEFIREARASFSLSPYLTHDAPNFSKGALRDEEFYVGYDIHPENLEALFFEGLNLPRWGAIPGESPAQSIAKRTELHEKSFQETTSAYPLLGRVRDINRKVVYTPEEVIRLREECGRALDSTNDAKAIKALHKFYIACNKAAEQRTGLLLIPS